MPTCLIAYQFDISYVCRFLSILAAMIIICSDIRSTTGRMLVYMLHINAECLPTARLTASALASPIAICFLIAPSQQLSRVRLDSIISNNTKMAAKKDMRRLDLGKQCFIWLHISQSQLLTLNLVQRSPISNPRQARTMPMCPVWNSYVNGCYGKISWRTVLMAWL